ncbi:hypothetical protein GCM10010236_81720 [Streptomyces eurythermus]|nr:hypothetical protein GCM10010236_81720 [Streptomyces eurythermus]
MQALRPNGGSPRDIHRHLSHALILDGQGTPIDRAHPRTGGSENRTPRADSAGIKEARPPPTTHLGSPFASGRDRLAIATHTRAPRQAMPSLTGPVHPEARFGIPAHN